MKKLIAVFSVALVLIFSCVLTSFADDSVVSGYAVDNVPYSDSFDGVLTSSASGSQIYSASEHKTYNSSSAVSAPSTVSAPLFSASSIIDMIPKNIWRSNNDTGKLSFPVYNGRTGVSYSWTSELKPNTIYHYSDVSERAFLNLKSNRKYRFTFSVYCPTRSKGTFDFYLAASSAMDTPVIELFHNNAPPSGGGNLWVGARTVTIEYLAPNNVSTLIPVIRCKIYGLEFVFYINNFSITDITTEDLDKSLDRLGDKIDSSINPSVPYEKWDNGDLKSNNDKLDKAMGELPTVDFDAIQELKNSIDISSYSHAFASINQLFIRLVDTVGITPLIFFACFFGFCIFLIGRKLSGG